jgi:hypothetical protein
VLVKEHLTSDLLPRRRKDLTTIKRLKTQQRRARMLINKANLETAMLRSPWSRNLQHSASKASISLRSVTQLITGTRSHLQHPNPPRRALSGTDDEPKLSPDTNTTQLTLGPSAGLHTLAVKVTHIPSRLLAENAQQQRTTDWNVPPVELHPVLDLRRRVEAFTDHPSCCHFSPPSR